MMRSLVLALPFLCAAPMAVAHPHVFVDVGLKFETGAEGEVTAIEVTWRYDSLFSLLILSDRGLDLDGDMALTEGERAELIGFDLTDWEAGFDGALFLKAGDEAVALEAPEALSLVLEDGQIVTRHRRPLAAPVALNGLTVRPFDPSYYAALTLSGEVILPEGCAAGIEAPDKARADAEVEAMGGFGDEGVFEEALVGHLYADTLTVTCAGS